MAADEVAQEAGPFQDEREEVWRWRLEQFVLLGFTDQQAMLLGRSEADLSQARYLRSSGCSCTLAVSILL
jgi:hypothetical protein